MKLSDEMAGSLMTTADGLIQSIKNYDRNFYFENEAHHDCVLTGYRDTAFGILFSLFMLNYITSGDFHRKICDMNTAIYKKIR